MTLLFAARARGTGKLLGFLLLAMCLSSSFARVERLDDSASPRASVISPPMVSEQGRPLEQYLSGPLPTVGIVNFGRVEYRLATAKYLGQIARIYYVVPVFIAGLRSPSGLLVQWRTTGAFASGSARPGMRTLVWSGTVRDAMMSEQLELNMRIDLRELQLRTGENLSFESFFEIEVSP